MQFVFLVVAITRGDIVKFAAARLTAKEAPSPPDTEQTFDELRARIGKVVDYLETFSPSDLETAASRWVTLQARVPWSLPPLTQRCSLTTRRA